MTAHSCAFFLLLPPLYVVCEIAGNTFVASFAAKLIKPSETVVLAQQAATTMKFASGFGSLELAAISLVVAGIASLVAFIRKQS